MSISRKYHKSSLYYPDDKDLYDFLNASSPSLQKLRAYLTIRGVYLSKDAKKDDYYNNISRLPLSWTDLTELVDLVDLAEKKEKSTFTTYDYTGPSTSISVAFTAVSKLRSDIEKESYKITQKNGVIIVDVEYIDIDNSKTPMLQGRPAALRIELTAENGKIKTTHTSNEAAADILKTFEAELAKLNIDDSGEPTKVKSSRISLRSILDPKLRVEFFTNLIKSLAGFDYNTTTNVKVARMPKNLSIESDEDEEKLSDEEEQRIKNVIIQGVNIQETSQYQDLLDEGFFISQITWESIERVSRDKVSLSAGFKNGEEGEGFEYKVNFRYLEEKGVYSTKDKVLPMKVADYDKVIQESASVSLDAILAIAVNSPTEPAEKDSL